MTKIILFENENFEGRSLVVVEDNPDLGHNHFNDKTSSIIVITGQWTLSQRSNYKGDQWTVSEVGGPDRDGTYPNWNTWNGINDNISSLKQS